MPAESRYWGVIPAAGVGSRMQTDIPKQYLQLGDKTIIENTLDVFCGHEQISGVVVAISDDDNTWQQLPVSKHKKIITVSGGMERCYSVLNCLHALAEKADKNDWVLVHDAARPCINKNDISYMIENIAGADGGGILALPVRDTMKRGSKNNHITETVNREFLWHALTPQMFRLGLLITALKDAIENRRLVTDEAQAMELSGYRPLLIQGNPRNIKITHQDDLSLAKIYLDQMKTD